MFKRHYISILRLIEPNVFGFKKKCFGRDGDGTYILPSELIEDSREFVLMSFGVNDDVSFEKQFQIEFPNISVYSFDPTIEELPEKVPGINFFKIGVARENIRSKKLSSLDSIISKLKIEREKLILKLDIEGWEWGVISKISDSTYNIPILATELHFFPLTSKRETLLLPIAFYEKYKILKKLTKKYYIYHIHANNYEYVRFRNAIFPTYLELTLIQKEYLDDLVKNDIKELNQPTFINKDDYQYPFFK